MITLTFHYFLETETQWGQGQWHDHDVPSWKTEFNLCQNTKDADVVDPEIQDPEQIELQENLLASNSDIHHLPRHLKVM